MPNHCENDLFINGDSAKVDEVLAFVGTRESEFSFNSVLPYPAKYQEMDEAAGAIHAEADKEKRAAMVNEYQAKYGTSRDGYNSGGHEWCMQNWGTKWDAYEVAVVTDRPVTYSNRKRMRISFRTAWSPPHPVIEKLAERFPDVSIALEYFECGMEFAGGYEYEESKYLEEGKPRKQGVWEVSGYKGVRGG